MWKLPILCLLLFSSLFSYSAIDSLKVYSWSEALKSPIDSVYAIDASKLNWKEIPQELYKFKHLHSLNLSKNKLAYIPDSIGVFSQLKTLDLTKNKLLEFPIALCQLTRLKKLVLARNGITSIPACIGFFKQLKVLDLWDNPLKGLPDELQQLSNLKFVDLRGILFNAAFQEKWTLAMPNVKWMFDAPCNCLN